MNPFDEIAVEEAIRLKDKGNATEVVVVSIGVKQAQETLRTALAIGADRAILIEAAADVQTDIEPLAVAKLLAAVVKEEAPGLVLAGILAKRLQQSMNLTVAQTQNSCRLRGRHTASNNAGQHFDPVNFALAHKHPSHDARLLCLKDRHSNFAQVRQFYFAPTNICLIMKIM